MRSHLQKGTCIIHLLAQTDPVTVPSSCAQLLVTTVQLLRLQEFQEFIIVGFALDRVSS